jgi:citrate lyase subunit beta/citryl-CoA lyase
VAASAGFRSLLFVPAMRIELLAKVPRWRPDALVIDLEDAVAVGDKDAARRAVANADLRVPGSVVLVRVNATNSPWYDEDVAAVAGSTAAGIVVPKAEDAGTLMKLRERLGNGVSGRHLVLGIESALGVAQARELFVRGTTSAYFGAEDYAADVGARRTPGGVEVLYARSEVVLAGRLAGIPVIDQAVVAVNDDAVFFADAEQGRNLGYAGKICVHPGQVALAHQVFTPTESEVAAARRMVEAADSGVTVVDGQMVDAVHTSMARQVLDRATHFGAGQADDQMESG